VASPKEIHYLSRTNFLNHTVLKIKYLIFFILLFLLAPGSFAQQGNLHFRHLNTNDGLSNNTVYSINEDSLGFIWVGTRSGLNRFDGHNFRIYDNRNGLKNGLVNMIFRDSKGRIWIGTQGGGLARYDYLTDNFQSFSNIPGDSASISHDDVQAIAEDSRGAIWAGTHEGGLNRLDEATGTFQRINFKSRLPAGFRIDRINTLLMEHDTLLWIGTLDGLYQYNTLKNRIKPVFFQGKTLNVMVLSLFSEVSGKIWLGTNKGIIRMDKRTGNGEMINTTNSPLSSDLIQNIRQSPDGKILIATDGGGLNFYDPLTGAITSQMSNPNTQNSLSNNSVYDIFYDRYNGLWIGNYNGGLNYYSEYDWKFIPVKHEANDNESLSDNHVRSFYQDRDGFLWIGTLGGLNQYNPITGKFRSFTFSKSATNSLSSNSVLSIYEEPEGNLWIGTFGGGISIFNKRSDRFTKYKHPDDLTGSLDKANVYNILETRNNKLCIATTGGIYLLDRSSNRMRRFQTSNSALSNNTVKVLCKDRHGIIWAGTNTGLNRFDPESGTLKVYRHSNDNPKTLSNNRILSVMEAKDGKIWIGTEGGGVNIFDPVREVFTAITMEDGLPDNVVNSVLQDLIGNLWFATNKGLVRYDPGQRRMRVYTTADGLQANEFNQNSAYRARDGKLYFGGIQGFNVFMPGNLISNTFTPRVLFTDLFTGSKRVSPAEEGSPLERQLFLTRKITLSYETGFEIHFAAIGFINNGCCQYSTQMVGQNDNWTEFRDQRSVTYSNLRPGHYTLMVRAINNDGILSESPAVIDIQILPPWWKTLWAYLVYLAVIAGLLILFMRYNTSWIRVKNQLILERKEKEQLEELNQMKLGFFTNISHEFKTPLTLILGHLDNLKGSVSGKQAENLINIEKNAKRLLLLINQLLEFRKAETGLMKLQTSKGNIVNFIRGIKESFDEVAAVRKIRFDLITHGAIPEIWFDAEKVEKIIFNLLSNAFKYADEGGTIVIMVKQGEPAGKSFPGGSVEISVRDNGPGIAPEDLQHLFERFYHGKRKDGTQLKTENSGIGLAFSKRLVELHHGEISVSSEPGMGSLFMVKLPVGKDHLAEEEIREEVSYKLRLDYHGLSGEFDENETVVQDSVSADDKLPILLVVDDNPMICQVLTEKFSASYQVATAKNGLEGLEKAEKYIPDVIISDILMPEMDGITFCQRIKANISTSHIPVVLLTAKSGEDTQILGIKTGADAYIAKPYNPELLQATVENLISSRKILRNKFSGREQFVPAEIVNNKLDEQFLLKLIKLIENDQEPDGIDILGLCREMAMSRSVLYRKIKALTGNSIQDFVRIVKLRKASRLLTDPSLSIADIAFQSGFANTKHFSTAFKKQFGKTPSEFRQAGA
jgi:ligand-binding sensor domain-containing protein/signal transduction histidine kinase/DNA-binding response OmpR family regulator